MEAAHDLLRIGQHAQFVVQQRFSSAPIQASPGNSPLGTTTPVIRSVSCTLHQLVEVVDAFGLIDDGVDVQVEGTCYHTL